MPSIISSERGAEPVSSWRRLTRVPRSLLAAPVATVTAKFDETNKEERVRFGRVGTDVFAARGEEPGAARVETSAYDQAMKSLDALK